MQTEGYGIVTSSSPNFLSFASFAPLGIIVLLHSHHNLTDSPRKLNDLIHYIPNLPQIYRAR